MIGARLALARSATAPVIHTHPTPSTGFGHAGVMGKKKRQHAKRPRPSGGGGRPHSGGNRPRPEPRSGQLATSTGYQSGSAAAQLQVMVGLITTGTLDAHLGTLQAAISKRHQDRRREASNQAAAQFQIGDRVALTEGIRPLYLQGATGTVTGWAHQNAIVHLDHPTGRSPGGEIRCPPLGLRRLVD